MMGGNSGMHMVGGWGMPGALGLFGGLMMLGMWLLPVLTLGLFVAGIVWVAWSQTKNNQ